MKLSDFTTRIMRKNTTNATDIPLTISSKDGLINQNDFFNKQVASKDMSGYYLLHRGEYAYNKSYSVGYDFGSIKRLEKYDMGALSTLYICFSLTKFNSDFIKHYFDSLKWYREIYMISAEGARNHGLLNVPTEDFFATLHTLPTDEAEQAKIASFLDALTARIEKQRSLVENLKKYKRGLLQRILRHDNEWEEVSLSEVLFERKTYCEKDGTYEHATLSKEGVYGKTDRYDRDYLVMDEEKKYKITHFGDLCYNPANLKFGVICLNTYGDAIFSPIYITFEIADEYNKEFIGLLLTRADFINRALKYQQGTVYERMAVSPEDLLTMKIKVPPLETQNRIAHIFTEWDALIKKNESVLEGLQNGKKQLLNSLFI